MSQWNPTNRIAAPIEADIPPEYITEEELDACSYVTALTDEQMSYLFPLQN